MKFWRRIFLTIKTGLFLYLTSIFLARNFGFWLIFIYKRWSSNFSRLLCLYTAWILHVLLPDPKVVWNRVFIKRCCIFPVKLADSKRSRIHDSSHLGSDEEATHFLRNKDLKNLLHTGLKISMSNPKAKGSNKALFYDAIATNFFRREKD